MISSCHPDPRNYLRISPLKHLTVCTGCSSQVTLVGEVNHFNGLSEFFFCHKCIVEYQEKTHEPCISQESGKKLSTSDGTETGMKDSLDAVGRFQATRKIYQDTKRRTRAGSSSHPRTEKNKEKMMLLEACECWLHEGLASGQEL